MRRFRLPKRRIWLLYLWDKIETIPSLTPCFLRLQKAMAPVLLLIQAAPVRGLVSEVFQLHHKNLWSATALSYLKHYTQDGEIHRGLPGPCRQTMGLDSETETDSQWEHCKTYQFAICEMLNRSCSWQQTRSAIELRQKYRWGVEGHEPQQRRWHRGLDWYKEAQA
jgi:hypothetical protein